MAFYQPTLAPSRHPPSQASYHIPIPAPPIQQRPVQESQEWILFPDQTCSSTQTQTTFTESTSRTAGLSRLSDLGSLESVARSENDEVAIEDDDFDSLDDGLHAFQEPFSLYQGPSHHDQGDSILPTHDGLGTFPASSTPVQEHLWHFEQYNPRKRTVDGHHRRRSSVQRRLDAVADEEEATIQRERVERIQRWRLEQSKTFLDEVEKQTKRRSSHTSQRSPEAIKAPEGKAVQLTAVEADGRARSSLSPAYEGSESFWQRVTRRVIRDFIGIDDALLSVILGESLPTEPSRSSLSLSATSSALALSLAAPSSSGWEDRLLDRLGRELGIVVQQLSENPGGFGTHAIPRTPDYAGIPIMATPTMYAPSRLKPQESVTASSTKPFFKPTLQQRPASSHSESTHAALWGIEEEASPEQTQSQLELDFWERPPTLKTIFRFLHQRFTSSHPTPPRPTNIATATTPDRLRRAAIVRAHHPLVSRAQGRRSASGHGYGYRRPESSCASISAKRRRSGSSRNYWDLGGSTASGSAIVAGAYGAGAWGEV